MMSFLCGWAIVASLFSGCNGARAPVVTGYIEGDYVFVAPIESGRIARVAVRRGQHVRAGEVLAELVTEDVVNARAEAAGRLKEAEAKLENLLVGKRPQEIAVTEATLAAARADAVEAEANFRRQMELVDRKVASEAVADQARSRRNQAKARVEQIEAEIVVSRLGARPQEIEAARRAVEAARAALSQTEWRLAERTLKAPSDGLVDDVVRHMGETAGPTAPVISFLPDGARKIRFYVPEPLLARVRIGGRLPFGCDSCAAGLEARVTYIASTPEYTPPVIYSVESRQKLVVLIEAALDGEAARLAPGQIVDVHLAPVRAP
ncbi:HlyD family secretion protein [Vineibacter terrae]|uniref:HlyD family secretion protein n=1 Tax=Vineibacter terrae TaxID=2586908 RepID=UPI002E32DDC8|nr:HlyD family efflux transporter periplasmic adaptor subunit [Vineibacter terrae]HEX2889967.1 HlyD family efflux transporter periplasmic adaptor subunit [Vineibacter terrae]